MKKEESLKCLLSHLCEMLFGQKEPYLIHLLRKRLGTELRKNLRENLGDTDVIIYSDFSKGQYIKLIKGKRR